LKTLTAFACLWAALLLGPASGEILPGTASWLDLTPYTSPGLRTNGPATKARIERAGGNLVITVRCAEPEMNRLVAKTRGSGDVAVCDDDSVEIFIATERANYFQLIANTAGALYAQYVTPTERRAWQSDAAVDVQKGNDSYVIKVSVPVRGLITGQTVSPGRINVCRNRRAGQPTLYYTLQGWYHKPDEWLTADITGQEKPAVVGQTPQAPVTPAPHYDMRQLAGLHPSNRWIQKEKMRVFCGWPLDTFRYRRNKNITHTVYDYLDQAAEAEFNTVILGDVGELGWVNREFLFDCASSAAIHARLKGLRVLWHMGYLYIKPAAQAKEEVGVRYRAVTPRTGKVYTGFPCPLDEKHWQDKFDSSILKAIAWEKEHKIRLTCGYVLDVEPQFELEECVCDRCFGGFLEKKKVSPPTPLKPEERFGCLTRDNLLDEYHDYLTEELVKILLPLREKVLKATGDPAYLFGFYPGHAFGRASWMCRAMARAMGTPGAPVLIWDDAMYWNGYTGSYRHIEKCQEFLRTYLGYEPLYLPSICYVTAPRYPSYTAERAGRELYLLNGSSAGTLCYGEIATGKSLWESTEPFFPAFRQANERLKKDRYIESGGPSVPSWLERRKLQSLKAEIDQRIEESLHGKPTDKTGPRQDTGKP